ncbi:hypothetical protein PMAYCL1PPCAC_23271 [Pristionchus mayeri]|uniref:Uncharacterized protein n=1 Tax=Pristionchus mayeri TaxID=1317129 RepID=A0AAN5CXR9_9BILA|nr:hypothetical protein PMAYCL1PPCAC_23271 [Pristionchus mayeri]
MSLCPLRPSSSPHSLSFLLPRAVAQDTHRLLLPLLFLSLSVSPYLRSTTITTVPTQSMAQAPSDQQHPPSVVGILYNEHERTARFQENLVKRPRDCDPTSSFETKWAFSVAESKRADVEKKTSNQLTSATMTISFALREVKEEITEIDSLLRGINVREHELESMTNSLDKMCLTLSARSIDRKKRATAASNSSERGTTLGRGGVCESEQHEDVEMKTAVRDETTITGPTSNVSTADEISMAEHPPPGTTVLGKLESHHHATTSITAQEIDQANSHFDYSALSAYTPVHQRTPCKMDSTFTCPRTAPKSRSTSRSRSERRV